MYELVQKTSSKQKREKKKAFNIGTAQIKWRGDSKLAPFHVLLQFSL